MPTYNFVSFAYISVNGALLMESVHIKNRFHPAHLAQLITAYFTETMLAHLYISVHCCA